jgi:hypothetical protein
VESDLIGGCESESIEQRYTMAATNQILKIDTKSMLTTLLTVWHEPNLGCGQKEF